MTGLEENRYSIVSLNFVQIYFGILFFSMYSFNGIRFLGPHVMRRSSVLLWDVKFYSAELSLGLVASRSGWLCYRLCPSVVSIVAIFCYRATIDLFGPCFICVNSHLTLMQILQCRPYLIICCDLKGQQSMKLTNDSRLICVCSWISSLILMCLIKENTIKP